MNIVVLGGSPKGARSVTMQYVRFIKSRARTHNFTEYYVAFDIRTLESDDTAFSSLMEDIRNADAVLWAFPLYFGLVHGSCKRFIELIWEKNFEDVFRGKHCAILCTSIHFFDHTAIEYIRGISEDLGMSVDQIFSAAMDDILQKKGKEQVERFWIQWEKNIKDDIRFARRSLPVVPSVRSKTTISAASSAGSLPHPGTKLGILTESGINENLDSMVDLMKREFSRVQFFDLSQIKIAGPCLGCLRCGYANQCVYEGKDDVISMYRELRECDVLVFAGTIQDRYLSARWKTCMDRLFFTTHIPFFDQKHIGFLIAGPLRQIPSLRDWFTGFFEADGLTVAGIVNDEDGDIPAQVHNLGVILDRYHQDGYHPPRSFPGEAGHRIFRDEIFGGLKGCFVADHKYYKKHGLYDFPHKNRKKRLAGTFLYLSMKLPFMRKEVRENMSYYMIRAYKNITRDL